MNEINYLNLYEIQSELAFKESKIGTLIGISDQQSSIWKCALHLGNNKFVVLYERRRGVNTIAFKKLYDYLKQDVNKNLNEIDFDKVCEFIDLEDSAEYTEYYIYDLNVFETPAKNKIKQFDFIQTVQFNLAQIETLEEGDIISFRRGWYSHHAILTDSSRMIVTHRSGEPNDASGSLISLQSILGFPSDKACVTENHLIEVAGYDRLIKSNEVYDSLHMPRPKSEIVKEAKSRIGEKGYSLRSRNCQHFASECRNGTSYAPEVQGVVTGAKTTAILAGLALTGITISKYFYRDTNKQSTK